MIKLFIFLLLASCGDSPFLDDPIENETSPQVQNLQGKYVFKSEGLNFNFYLKNSILIGEEVKFLIIFTNKDGIPTSPKAKFNLKLWMPNMGHGSFPTTVHEAGIGVFEISEIFFTMPGRWDIHFQLMDLNEKVKEEILWAIDI